MTETIGAFAFDERILSSVIDARARLLKPDAIIIPRSVDLYLVPVDDASIYERSVSWWNECSPATRGTWSAWLSHVIRRPIAAR